MLDFCWKVCEDILSLFANQYCPIVGKYLDNIKVETLTSHFQEVLLYSPGSIGLSLPVQHSILIQVDNIGPEIVLTHLGEGSNNY